MISDTENYCTAFYRFRPGSSRVQGGYGYLGPNMDLTEQSVDVFCEAFPNSFIKWWDVIYYEVWSLSVRKQLIYIIHHSGLWYYQSLKNTTDLRGQSNPPEHVTMFSKWLSNLLQMVYKETGTYSWKRGATDGLFPRLQIRHQSIDLDDSLSKLLKHWSLHSR